ncbi:MAG: hypothetical protein ACR2QH_17045 [Geminicoccaceae bacterium]
MLNMVQDLCRAATGSRCQQPRMSNWKLVNPSQSNISVDVADVATAGGGAIAPVNIKVYGSYFVSGLENHGIGLSSQVQGYGAGAGVGAGWGLPFVGARAVGKVPDGIKKEILKRVGGSVQGKVLDIFKDLAGLGISGGTQMITGPDAPSADLTPADFHGCFATIFSFGANFVVNGVNVGMIVFSQKQPVTAVEDLVYAKAFGLIAGVGLATSLDLEASGMAYRTYFM